MTTDYTPWLDDSDYSLKNEYVSSDDQEQDNVPDAVNQAPIPIEPFRLLDLPAELRVRIYSFVLPHNMVISFAKPAQADGDQPAWIVRALPTGSEDLRIGSLAFDKLLHRLNYPTVETQLFFISKSVSNEARAALYSSNTFKFTIDGQSHYPTSLRSPLIFGPLGKFHRLPLLRNLRSIHIDVTLDNNSHWVVKRQRGRLAYFVEVLKEHADDENKKSLLQKLKVAVRLEPPKPRVYNGLTPRRAEKFIFSLDSLAGLRGIKDVEITGSLLPDWYAECLQLCIQGKGGEVQETNWPQVKVKRKCDDGQTKKVWVTTRKWYQPTLDWQEYAERNDIAVPDDIGRFWAAER